MPRTLLLRLYLVAFALLPFCLGGCTSGAGGAGSFFSQGHKLSDEAKEMRDANAQPLLIPRELEKQPQQTFVVEPGDVLLIQPVDLDSPAHIPADQPILPDGTVNLGKYGPLMVMGRTVEEIEGMVRTAVLKQTKDAGFISVRLISRQSKVYYVIGEVNSPGTFQLRGNETVLDALMQAGGLNDKSSRDNIILSRPTKPNCPRMVLPVCWKNIVQLGDSTTNYQIAAGDRIYVPTRTFCESLPGFNRHAKTPCKCSINVPQTFPPYPGDSCIQPPDGFHGPNLPTR